MTDQEDNHSAKDIVHPENVPLLIAEYTALREEIRKHIEIQHQIIALTLTASGIVLTVGLQMKDAAILLVYPILTLFLAVVWTDKHINIVSVATYIRKHIEPRTPENAMGWERYACQSWTRFQAVTSLGPPAFFIITELLAILTGVSVSTFNAIEKVLLTLDVLSILLSAILFILAGTRHNTDPTMWRKILHMENFLHPKEQNRPYDLPQ